MLSGTSTTFGLFHAQSLSVQSIISKYQLRLSMIIMNIIIIIYYNLKVIHRIKIYQMLH